MNVPAKYREAIYWVVLVATVLLGVLSGVGVVPEDAVARGGEVALQLLTVIGAALALLNIKPDEPTE